jgi:hypothetical protein
VKCQQYWVNCLCVDCSDIFYGSCVELSGLLYVKGSCRWAAAMSAPAMYENEECRLTRQRELDVCCWGSVVVQLHGHML